MRYKTITKSKYFIVFALMLLVEQIASAREYSIDRSQSIFAVLTHKGGFAAQLAHNHFVFANDYEENLFFDQDTNALHGNLQLTIPVAALQNDLPAVNTKWSHRILELKLLKEDLPTISEADRESIHKTMLSAEQLDVEKFPTIHVSVSEIQKNPTLVADEVFQLQVKVSVTLHGKTVERLCPANIVSVADQLKAESVGRFTFSEFGIVPYSALMGAVANLDEFHVYVNLSANSRS